MIEIRCECRGKLTLCTPVLFHPNHERFKSFFLLCCPVSWQDKTHAKTRWRSVRKPYNRYENISVKTAQNFYFFFLVSALVFKIKLKEFQFQRSEQAGNQVFIDSEPERPLLCLYF